MYYFVLEILLHSFAVTNELSQFRRPRKPSHAGLGWVAARFGRPLRKRRALPCSRSLPLVTHENSGRALSACVPILRPARSPFQSPSEHALTSPRSRCSRGHQGIAWTGRALFVSDRCGRSAIGRPVVAVRPREGRPERAKRVEEGGWGGRGAVAVAVLSGWTEMGRRLDEGRRSKHRNGVRSAARSLRPAGAATSERLALAQRPSRYGGSFRGHRHCGNSLVSGISFKLALYRHY